MHCSDNGEFKIVSKGQQKKDKWSNKFKHNEIPKIEQTKGIEHYKYLEKEGWAIIMYPVTVNMLET